MYTFIKRQQDFFNKYAATSQQLDASSTQDIDPGFARDISPDAQRVDPGFYRDTPTHGRSPCSHKQQIMYNLAKKLRSAKAWLRKYFPEKFPIRSRPDA